MPLWFAVRVASSVALPVILTVPVASLFPLPATNKLVENSDVLPLLEAVAETK